MSKQTTPITERQLDLITRAHLDCQGLIEPLLNLKGGAKIRMLTSLAQRGLIEQVDGQWRITPAAIAIVKGETLAEDVPDTLPEAYPIPTFLNVKATATDDAAFALDAETEAAVATAEATWQAEKQAADQRPIKAGVEGQPKQRENERSEVSRSEAERVRSTRQNSKQAQVIEMLKRPEGATIAQISEVTAWQAHTTRGFFAGTVKKKLGLAITSHKPPQGERIYHLEAAVA